MTVAVRHDAGQRAVELHVVAEAEARAADDAAAARRAVERLPLWRPFRRLLILRLERDEAVRRARSFAAYEAAVAEYRRLYGPLMEELARTRHHQPLADDLRLAAAAAGGAEGDA